MEHTLSTSDLSWPRRNCLAAIYVDNGRIATNLRTILAKYKFVKALGSGSFGEVWLGLEVNTGEKVAIKVESAKASIPQLQREYMLYKRYLQGVRGFPEVKHYASAKQCTYFVMTLLGHSLQKLLTACEGRFSLKTTLMLADQLLQRLEDLHTKTGYVTRDVKPDNLLMGRPGTNLENVLFLVDLGLSRPFVDFQSGGHVEARSVRRNLTGTARFASINAHNGADQSRRDDLESAGYVFVYLLKGKLPWQGVKASTKRKRYERIKAIKQKTSIADLCEGIPAEFRVYLQYCRSLGFNERPDYSYLRGLFQDVLDSKGYRCDHIYDWKHRPIDFSSDDDDDHQLK